MYLSVHYTKMLVIFNKPPDDGISELETYTRYVATLNYSRRAFGYCYVIPIASQCPVWTSWECKGAIFIPLQLTEHFYISNAVDSVGAFGVVGAAANGVSSCSAVPVWCASTLAACVRKVSVLIFGSISFVCPRLHNLQGRFSCFTVSFLLFW